MSDSVWTNQGNNRKHRDQTSIRIYLRSRNVRAIRYLNINCKYRLTLRTTTSCVHNTRKKYSKIVENLSNRLSSE